MLQALSILIVKLTTLAFRNPRGTTFCGASRDLLRLALSIISFKLTTPSYRGPNGTSFARTSFDQPLSALSILQQKKRNFFVVKFLFCLIVRVIGLEPTRRKTPDPKSGASTNFATRAIKLSMSPERLCKDSAFFLKNSYSLPDILS